MSCNAGPKIVKDGLVLAVDARNTESYPGSGTAWNNLVGSGIGTLTGGGPGFNGSIYGGVLTFDSTNDYVDFGSSDDFAFGTGDYTIEVWCYPFTRGVAGLISIGDNDSSLGSWEIRYNGGGIVEFLYSGTNSISSPSSTVSDNEWTQVVATRSGTALTLYINAVSEATGTSSADLSDTGPLQVGSTRTPVVGDRFDGHISIARLYKGKALSAAEVKQNFNTSRERYKYLLT